MTASWVNWVSRTRSEGVRSGRRADHRHRRPERVCAAPGNPARACSSDRDDLLPVRRHADLDRSGRVRLSGEQRAVAGADCCLGRCGFSGGLWTAGVPFGVQARQPGCRERQCRDTAELDRPGRRPASRWRSACSTRTSTWIPWCCWEASPGSSRGVQRVWFAIGAVTASAVWFYGLGLGARWLAPLFRKPMAWRVLDLLIGCVMWTIAASLVLPEFA